MRFKGNSTVVSWYINGAKLQTLLEESKSCAVLDAGCSRTVCGNLWLHDYLCSLLEFKKSNKRTIL